MADRERIKDLILRNDFSTAEAIMRKSGLSLEERRELEEQIETRKRLRERERKKKRRRDRFVSRLGKFNLYAWKGFAAVFCVLGMITAYYNHSAYLSSLDSYDGPPFQHIPLFDFLNLLAGLDMTLFWGLVILEAVLDRDKWSLERFRGVFLVWLVMFLTFLLIFLRGLF